MPKPMNFYEFFRNRRVEVLREMLHRQKFYISLDVGAAHGMLKLLGLRESIGIDVRHDGGVSIRASAENLPFNSEVFDLVFAGEVIEHPNQPMKALREWARVLTPNGTMILSTPNGALVSAVRGNPEHKATYSPRDINGGLGKLGLKTIAAKGIFTGLVSGRRLFRLVPFSWMKVVLPRVPVPVPLAYDVYFEAVKET